MIGARFLADLHADWFTQLSPLHEFGIFGSLGRLLSERVLKI